MHCRPSSSLDVLFSLSLSAFLHLSIHLFAEMRIAKKEEKATKNGKQCSEDMRVVHFETLRS